jgi:uncharacterized protein
MERRRLPAALGALSLVAALAGTALAQPPPMRVVYHLSEGEAQATRALQYIRNHLEADPAAQIMVVTHALGVDFLMQGAKSAKGNEYRGAIEDLELAGVRFVVCEITLRERGLRREQFLPEARFVPSGVAEIARLQAREGFGYLKP